MRVGLDLKQMKQSTAETYCKEVHDRTKLPMQAVQVKGHTVALLDRLNSEVGFLGDALVDLTRAAKVMTELLGGDFPFVIIDERNQVVRSEREYWQALEGAARAWYDGKRRTDALFAEIDALVGPPGVAAASEVYGWPDDGGSVTTGNDTRSPAEHMARPTPFPDLPPRT